MTTQTTRKTTQPTQALAVPIRGGSITIDPLDLDLMDKPWYLSSNGHALRSDYVAGTGSLKIWHHLIRDIAVRLLGRPLAPGEYSKPLNRDCTDARRCNIGIGLGGPRSFPVPVAEYLAGQSEEVTR